MVSSLRYFTYAFFLSCITLKILHLTLSLLIAEMELSSLASASVNIGQLEHQLILSVDPWRIRQILIELHGMTSERQFWTVSNKVRNSLLRIDMNFINFILHSRKNAFSDFFYLK